MYLPYNKLINLKIVILRQSGILMIQYKFEIMICSLSEFLLAQAQCADLFKPKPSFI